VEGIASYYDVLDAKKAAWTYRAPTEAFASIAGWLALYAGPIDYGGWITKDLVGPFEGAPGTQGW
jgi:hypothetical protein